MSEFKSDQIKTVLKDLLKKKKLTYEDVAEELECSVPTIKRILGPEELSLPRLLKLCTFLDVTLSDIEALMKIDSSPTERLTAEQEQFLAKNPHYFAYFYSLFNSSPEEIAVKYQLSSRSTDKYLLNLEKQGLIKVTGKLKVKPAFKEAPTLGTGVLAKAYFKSFIENGAAFFTKVIETGLQNFNPQDNERIPQGFSLNAVKSTKHSYTQFVREQNKAREAFFKLASYEEKSLPASELYQSVIMAAFANVESDDKNLSLIDRTFSEVKNL